MPSDSLALKALYDERYRGEYMDRDCYGTWSRRDAGLLKVKEILRRVPGNHSAILDYGCGQGGWIDLLSAMSPEARISGVDISDVAIAKARERFPFHEFSSFDGGRAPFPDGSFDLVFSYHVLEHVADVEASVAEIGRLVRPGGHACIIFPCGNRGSFEERIIRMMKGGREPAPDGGTVFFYETGDGHLRRMTTDQTAVLFKGNGFSLVCAWHSGQFFGAVDWLCRASGPGYIRKFFFGRPPVSRWAGVMIRAAAAFFLGVNWIVRKKNLDLSKKRSLPKQAAVVAARYGAGAVDWLVAVLSQLEWRLCRGWSNGSAQHLVFKKV